jgi:hypothetical protein
MSRGVYIVANDRVYDQAIALLSSLRLQDPTIEVFMIPFDQNYHKVWSILQRDFDMNLYPNLDFLEKFTQDIADIFPRDFLRLPNKMRKLAVWFGPLDEFAYIDTDILLFQSITHSLNYLNKFEFFACDFHYKGRGIAEVFSPVVKEKSVFTRAQLQDVFNSGFWGSRKGIFSYEEMLTLLQECADHRDYFDFSTGTTDQPIINYLVLKGTKHRINIARVNPEEPGSWAGSAHFEQKNWLLYDGDQPLRYLHWAGTPLHPGGPYWELWQHYRFRVTADSLQTIQMPEKRSVLSRIRKKLAI